MREIVAPFRNRQSLLQMGLCTLIFVGMAVPFKVMVLVEGFTEVRPVNAVPVVVGLLLGPAGAWGCAIGNLIADLFGTFSKASFLGFWGNFLGAYLPYKMWHALRQGEKPNVKSGLNLALYVFISALSSLTVAVFIACGLDVWLKMWFPSIFYIILFNNFGFPLALGLPVFIVLTSDDHRVEPVMPSSKDGSNRRGARFCLVGLVVVELAILILITQGYAISASPLLGLLGAVFLAVLVGFSFA